MKTILCFLLILVCSMTVFPHTSLAQNSRPMVNLIYFLPSDREPDPDIDAKMDTLIKDVQQFYANQMATHGFGRKTFQFETDARGNAVVHRVSGRFTDKHYINLSTTFDIMEEIEGRFDTSKHICLTVIDISSERIVNDGAEVCGLGGYYPGVGGSALIPASGICFDITNVAAHELGHAFGLDHDFRLDHYMMSYGAGPYEISKCAAEVLNVHTAFNLAQPALDTEETTSEMFPPSFAFAPNAIRLRFKVSDPDGLYQAQALVPGDEFLELLGCKRLNGNTRSTFEIITTYLLPKHKQTTIYLRVIDMQGNIYDRGPYPINVTDLLPPDEVVTIPDANLAAAVRKALGLNSGATLTNYMMLDLKIFRYLDGLDGGIRDLTGLEHCYNLTELDLDIRTLRSNIIDVSPLAGLTQLETLNLDFAKDIIDVSPLAGLTQLKTLRLGRNDIIDVSPLAGLTQLETLELDSNSIIDVSPLAGLTQLETLELNSNSIIDVSPLAGLTQLKTLNLWSNHISDVSPLARLTSLTVLLLYANQISDVSPLTGLTNLTRLLLDANQISDVSPLTGLTNLTRLDLADNQISDVSPLTGLTSVSVLYLSDNQISDVSPLARLTKLERLSLYNNQISDVSPLAGLTNLTWLSLYANQISDVSPLARLTNLTGLYLGANQISDVSPLARLTNLTGLSLDDNQITDFSPIAELIPNLEYYNNANQHDPNAPTATSKHHIATLDSGRSWGGVPIAFSPDGMILAAGAERGWVRLWDVATQTNVATTYGNSPSMVEDVAFSPDGVLLAVSNKAGGVELWDVAPQRRPRNVATFKTRSWFTNGVAFSPDGVLLAVGLEDGVELWDVATQTNVANFEHGVGTYDVEFSPDGVLLATVGFNSTVKLWDVATQTNVATFLQDDTPWIWVRSVAFSPDGVLLASGDLGSTVELWDVATERNIANLEHHLGVESVAFSPNGSVLASAGRDKMIKLWDVATGTPIASFPHSSSVESVAFSPNGSVLASGTHDGTIELWDVSSYITLLTSSEFLASDVNGDGIVNIQDLVLVASNLGKTGQNAADVNADGIVNIQDLVLVAGALGTSAAAPSIHPQYLEMLTAGDVKSWLSQAQHFNLTDAMAQKGILFLEQLLAVLTPKETALLHNFPNPFNPETWMPYHLVEPANVTLTIYSIDGKVVRRLDLGHQDAGYYQSKARAAYWDGRNSVGERVASGIYFYTLTAGDFAATRKMLIMK